MSLDGLASIHAEIVVRHGQWQSSGDMTVAGLSLNHSGDQLSSEQVEIVFGPIGSALPEQKIQSIDMQGWHYTAPLKPLTMNESANEAEADEPGPYWWATLLHNHNWHIGALNLDGGVISVGREDSQWAGGLALHAEGIQADALSAFNLQGRVNGGLLVVDGQWNPLSTRPVYVLKARLTHANPFFLNDWLQASGMPRLIRGRLSFSLNVGKGKTPGSHIAASRIQLTRGMVEASIFPDDPLLGRLGYGLADVLARLDDGRGRAVVIFDIEDNELYRLPDLRRFGAAMQQAIQAGIKKGSTTSGRAEAHHDEARIRLHESSGLSHNERTRLRKLWRQLKAHKDWILDLEPTWTGKTLNAPLIGRIRYTQALIEGFMHDRGISAGRVFPIWPTQQNHAEDLGFIHVLIRSPR